MTDITRDRYYPEMPPALPDESDAEYTDRLTGADQTDRVPYDHYRNRQCSIGYHNECTDPRGERCKCPCHHSKLNKTVMIMRELDAGYYNQKESGYPPYAPTVWNDRDKYREYFELVLTRLEKEGKL